ncbi:meiosis-specific nuclear structural protein 1-like [Achroia grisella]|uniref:meiosis-specific nuclear structural protein 1-like n=1 Tax=Achroia grisella TaxID=688607 RepID=UPI0027D32668|nr:meiosis-specific nuclear structural protein 1-like [Achroia grisella]
MVKIRYFIIEPKNELQRNAITESRRKELEVYERALDIQWLNNRMEDGRMGRCLALIQKEAEMEKEFQERTDHAAIVNARAQKETALGIEIAKVQQEETCELLRRHYLRERDPSLRDLVRKLQAGYVCRDLKQQILNNEYRRLQDKVQERHAQSVLRNALYNDTEAKQQEEKEKMERNTQYCKELQQQLVNRQRVKQCQYEDTLIEKKMLDDVIRTLADEDQRELQHKREQTEKIRNEMLTFQKAREAWRQKQKHMVIVEERRIEEQKKAAADRSLTVIAARQEKLRKREEFNARIGDKILSDEATRQERENIIKLLQEQEYLEKNVQDDIAAKEKLTRVTTDTKEALTNQMETRQRLAKEQREREAQFRKQAEAKMAAEEEKEREKERHLKEKRRQYAKQLRDQIADNTRRRELERRREEQQALNVWNTDKAWRSEVATERKQILQEHAPHLVGYLQAGVLQQEDLPVLKTGAEQHDHLRTLDLESLSIKNRPQGTPKCNAQCRILREY